MRLIDADAYAAEMKARQDACKDWLERLETLETNNWDTVYIHMARQALATFCEAKLTLDKTPTIDAVEVVRCKECVDYMGPQRGGNVLCYHPEGYCSQGRRRDGGEEDAKE